MGRDGEGQRREKKRGGVRKGQTLLVAEVIYYQVSDIQSDQIIYIILSIYTLKSICLHLTLSVPLRVCRWLSR